MLACQKAHQYNRAMALVYKYEDVARFTNPLPRETSIDFVYHSFDDLRKNGAIVGAQIYGSIAYENGTSPSSDIDILTAIPSYDPKSLLLIRNAVSAIEQHIGRAVELTICSYSDLKDGRHPLREGYLKTVLSQCGEIGTRAIIGNNPATIAKRLEMPLLEDVQNYLHSQRLLMVNDYINGVNLKVPEEALARALNIANNSGRKTIDALEINKKIQKTLKSARKSDISEAVSIIYGSRDPYIIELHDLIASYGKKYNLFVSEINEKDVTKEEYDQIILATALDLLPNSIEYLNRMIPIYSQLAGAK